MTNIEPRTNDPRFPGLAARSAQARGRPGGPKPGVKHASRLVVTCLLFAFLSTACMNEIWNAGDLADRVRDRAVEEGCERESIELDDWYTSENGRNNWRGRCLKQGGAEQMDFSINVDSVWTPSSGE